MRGLFIVNPRATSTTTRARDVIVRAFASELELRVTHTAHRGHATELARAASQAGDDVVVCLGGDGTVNEAANGILETPAGQRPLLAALPGGSANVFVRSLGLPADPIEASGAILESLRRNSPRTIGVGRLDDGITLRHFLFCAGLGWDASVIRAVEKQRRSGARASPARYAAAAVRVFLAERTLRAPAVSLEIPGHPPLENLQLALVTNTTPWTYAGAVPIQPTPRARFDLGLDAFATTRLDPATALWLVGQMVRPSGLSDRGRGYVSWHDEAEITLRATPGHPLQIDGEYLGERQYAHFTAIPNALQIVE
ncbi:diacylglycerol kinase family protein [Lipingzhangella sp. LS1_29]|uniref:Diacylglycerol kinase family protein n=1 Tax=Lipingzhangella rawalii TaxID=2055835 RepID=A0ABU2H9T4_9ACTN|nr:diacylglycerol kinase family protein [Lipingzhangella rawalii]MDS1272062.1 diacylglycerol kinase family protein [Lipingzhangella rawalii]